MRKRFTWLLGLSFLLFAEVLSAQSPDGLGKVPFGSYASTDIETINLYSGNVMLDIAVFSRSGREGLSTSLRLNYNQQGWRNVGTLYGPVGAYAGGWNIAVPTGQGGQVSPELVDCPEPNPPYMPPTGYWYVGVTWTDSSGALHVYEGPTIEVGWEDGGCDTFSWASWNNGGGDWLSPFNYHSDSTMAFLGVDGELKILLSGGQTIIGTGIETHNGNNTNLSVSGSGIFDDVLGRTIGYSSGSDTSGESYRLYTVKDTEGNDRTYRLNYKDCHTVHNPVEDTSDCIPNLLISIVLPNGRKYKFEYGHSQGFLTRVTLPTGGYIAYDYHGGNTGEDSENIENNYIVKRRVSADGSNEVEWDYTRTTSGSNRIVAVTTPFDQQVIHTFNSEGFETQTEWAENYSTTKLVQTTRGSGGQPGTVTTQVGDLKQQQTSTFSGFRMTESTQSDWYPAAGSVVPLAKTLYSYISASPSTLTFPAEVELQKWTGSSYTIQGKTMYFYDEYSLASTSNVPHHDSPWLSTRHNVTTVRRYRDASNYVEEHFHYDDAGNVVEHVDARDKSTTFSYADNYSDSTDRSSAAYPTSVTNAEGHEVETVYDFNTGLPMNVLDARGLETVFTYDELNRPETITEPNGSVTTYTYTDPDPDVAITLPKVAVQATVESGIVSKAETTFDLLLRPTQVKQFDPAGDVLVDTEYDDNGQVKRSSTPYRTGSPVWTQSTYDVLGRPLTITNPDSTTVTFTYDDNTVMTTDEAGNQRRQTFNGLGQLTKVEEPDPNSSGFLETNYSYYVFGSLAQVTQGGQTRTFTHNWLGWKTQEAHPETGTTSYTYFADGLLNTRTDARSKVTTYSYDNIGRPLTITYSDSTPDITYIYDQNTFTGFLTTADVDGVTNSAFEYNTAGALTEENVTLDGLNNGTFTTGYTYDLGGRLLTMTYPSGRVVTQSYVNSSGIASNRTNTLANSHGQTPLVSSVTDNAAGIITARQLANSSISETRTFNSRNQLTHITAAADSATLLDMGYGYGTYNDGRIRSRTDTVQPEHSAAYTFDEIGRLTAVSGGDSSWGISWALDRYGNRTAQTPSGLASGRVGAPSTAYNNNKIATSAEQYDPAGNMIYDGSHHYSYDAENRLVQINSSSTQYAYDYAGRRVKKLAGGVTTYYFYGLTGLTSEFSTTSGASGAASTDRLQYRVGEQTGTAVMLMDSSGTPRENNRVFPFGEPWLAFTGSTNNEKFTTYQHDNDDGSDLDYAMARHYASRSGRFMTPDPGHVGADPRNPQSWNGYVYVENDPINLIDPSGLAPEPCATDTCVSVAVSVELLEHLRPLLELMLFASKTQGSTQPPPPREEKKWDIEKKYERTYECRRSTHEVRTAVMADFNKFAAGSLGPIDVAFMGRGGGVAPIIDGHNLTVGLFARVIPPRIVPNGMAVVTPTTTSSGWYFTPVQGQHFFTPQSRINFSFTNSAGIMRFSITVNADYSRLTDELFSRSLGGENLENAMWNNVLGKVGDLCRTSS